jgi:diguanylate cyclase (GGDEF)-like protein
VLFDLTERKETEEKFRKHQEELEWLVAERTYELTRANELLAEAIREQKQRVLEMTQLNHMSDLLHACRTEQETHEVVIGVCKQLFPDDSGYLGIIDDSRTRLDIVADWGSSPPKVKLLDLEDCWALRRGKSHFVESSEIGPLCPHLSRSPGYSYLCEPIIAQGRILGVMHLRIGRREQVESDEAFKLMIESKQIILVRIVEHYSLSLVNLRLHETLKRQSIQDPLTNLYNRRYMEESLEREFSRCRRHDFPLTIIMIDIDHFKTFNDTYGHTAGDIVLQKLGEFLKKNIREEDIACRYGGEEFVLILPQTSPEPVRQRAEQMRSKVKEDLRIRYQGHILGITISMGIAGFPDHGINLNEILDTADLALYQAKKKGRDRVEVAIKTQ